jgi:putative ATPase
VNDTLFGPETPPLPEPARPALPPRRAPLADRMRPRSFADFVGQEELIGPGTVLRSAVGKGELTSLILWGPPGSGKTTLARLLAAETSHRFASFSAVTSGVAEVRQIIAEADARRRLEGRGTVLFVDEIHRFNRAQQDAFLPHVEAGTIVLVGATTENPSFEVNSALLSRCRVFVLRRLETEELVSVMRRALADVEHGLGELRPAVPDEVLEFLARCSDGDARTALNALELACLAASPGDDGRRRITMEQAGQALQRRTLLYDADREEHYNLISALHKALRGSDVQAGLYWAGRMLAGGEDPLFIARRLVRFASEDVGLADPQALAVTLAAKQACEFLGMPECDTALAQAVVYLATAPKSNAVYLASGSVRREVERSGSLPVPLHIRNAPTSLMKDLGYGHGYRYDHDCPEGFSGQEFLPDGLRGRAFYAPGEVGFEREVKKRMQYWARLKLQRNAKAPQEKPGASAPQPPDAAAREDAG